VRTAYVTIGNSDDKLGQAAWSAFCDDVTYAVNSAAQDGGRVHAACFSSPAVPWQNAIWCVELGNDRAEALQTALRRLAHRYRQDSIAYAEVDRVDFLAPLGSR
jgi:hypothetical protein